MASGLGIEWSAELLPQDKIDLINEMKQKSGVAIVGDGINDAPATFGHHSARIRPATVAEHNSRGVMHEGT